MYFVFHIDSKAVRGLQGLLFLFQLVQTQVFEWLELADLFQSC